MPVAVRAHRMRPPADDGLQQPHRSGASMHAFTKTFLLAALTPIGASATPLPRFPAGAVWNQDVTEAPLHAQSAEIMDWLDGAGGWGTGADHFQIDFSMVVLHADASAPTAPVVAYPVGHYYSPDCEDPGLAFPLPAGGAIEGSTNYACNNGAEDCHLLVVQGTTLFEAYRANRSGSGLQSQCAVRWHLDRVYPDSGRGQQCTSVDAAGFPVAPLLFNADEVYAAIQSHGDIGHAIRFILPNERMRADQYVYPATHAGSPENTNVYAPPYGSRLRLKARFDIDAFSANEGVRVILRTLKKYGMVLADGGNLPLTAEADTFTTHKWDEPAVDMDSHALFGIRATDFDVLATPPPIALTYDCVRNPEPDGDEIFANGFD
jgi:serine/threonine-protein kinase